MATVKKLNSTYTIDTTDVYLTGNLHVSGVYDTTNVTDSTILDKNLYLNSGETGAGVAGDGFSGLIIERGSQANVSLRWNEGTDRWQITNDGSTYANIISSTSGSSALTAVIEDPAPALGGNLNTYGKTLLSNIGNINFAGNIQINNTGTLPTAVTSATVLYAGIPNSGTSGIYVVNASAVNEELITKKRAVAFSILL
jgi:hypothetical protein